MPKCQGKLTHFQEEKQDPSLPPKAGTNPSFPVARAKNFGSQERLQTWTQEPLPSKREEFKGTLLPPRQWPAQPNIRPTHSRSTLKTSSAGDPPGTAPSPTPSPSPGAQHASPASHSPRRGRPGAHRARSSRRQGSVGEVRAAQVRDHQKGVPWVRRALKERAVLGPSHCRQDQG